CLGTVESAWRPTWNCASREWRVVRCQRVHTTQGGFRLSFRARRIILFRHLEAGAKRQAGFPVVTLTTPPLTTSRLTRFPQKITVERVVQLHGLSCSGGSHVCAPMVGADFRALSGPLSSPSALASAFGQSTGARRTYLRPPRGQTCFFRGRQSAR